MKMLFFAFCFFLSSVFLLVGWFGKNQAFIFSAMQEISSTLTRTQFVVFTKSHNALDEKENSKLNLEVTQLFRLV